MSPDSLCRWEVQGSIYCAWRIPAHHRCTPCFNPVATYGYPFPIGFMADIANPDLFVCGCRTWICLDINRFYEEHIQTCSVSA